MNSDDGSPHADAHTPDPQMGDTPTLDAELHTGWSWAQPEHIPLPTYWPAGLALGVTLLLWGLITSPLLTIIGLIVFATSLAGWIGELRNEHRQ
ncbi:MAG: hypothetical protein ACJ78Q_00750 [Chloroflexia bacterium]